MKTDTERTDQYLALAYQKAAERYNNIYQSVWTIFSYMSAVTAGLITFGATRLSDAGLGVVASLPLVFWFWSTYLPLDRYGNKTLWALRNIEEKVNLELQCGFEHFSVGGREQHGLIARYRAERRDKKVSFRKAAWETVSRARFAICFFSVILHGFLLVQVWNASHSGFGKMSEPTKYQLEFGGNQSISISTIDVSHSAVPNNASSSGPVSGSTPKGMKK